MIVSLKQQGWLLEEMVCERGVVVFILVSQILGEMVPEQGGSQLI